MLLIALVIFILAEVIGQRANSSCDGECLDIRKCPYAYNLLIEEHKITKLCYYNDSFPKVCCPRAANSGNVNSNQNTQKRIPGKLSQRKCEEYNVRIDALYLGAKSLAREFPHMAALGYGEVSKKEWLCGGAVVSDRFVLTAAHCLNGQAGPPKYVRLGDLDLEREDDDALPQEFKVDRVFSHPQYRHPAKYNDIALIKLDREIQQTDFVGVACLDNIRRHKEDKMIVTGWGLIEFAGVSSSHLLKAWLDIIDNGKCRSVYRADQETLPSGIVDDLMICAGGKSDTCYGDSGGPLVTKNLDLTGIKDVYNVIGITSFGKACGVSGDPGIYTRVQPYLEWLEKTIWPNA